MNEREQMNIVIVGHVDHGKSTIIGRLLADTNSLPEGKLEQIKEKCLRESRTFEYAFLLDALKDEQNQGITIDSARCFFKSTKRDYIIIDAPGHIEFLKNMISGAARAKAAILVIDAKEGIQENSKRHAYMLSMLGIKQVIVCVNKMDLVNDDEQVFYTIKERFTDFLKQIEIFPRDFIPVSAIEGKNIHDGSIKPHWYNGDSLLSSVDKFEKGFSKELEFRMPVQDVYKFSAQGDNRRIIVGRVESGQLNVGDSIIFLPSNKTSSVKSIENFSAPLKHSLKKGEPAGITLTEQIYVNRGEIMCKQNENLPHTSSLFRANIFWMGKTPLSKDRDYFLKLGTKKIRVKLLEILSTLDASNLNQEKKEIVERHEVASCIFESKNPISFDQIDKIEETSRFVLVDKYDISGGGIIIEKLDDPYEKIRKEVYERESTWEKSLVGQTERAEKYNQLPKLILITGKTGIDKISTAKFLEKRLIELGKKAYFLGIGNILRGLDADIEKSNKPEHLRRFSEVSHILLDAGLLVIATASDLNKDKMGVIENILQKQNMIIVKIDGESNGQDFDLKLNSDKEIEENTTKIISLLKDKNAIFSANLK